MPTSYKDRVVVNIRGLNNIIENNTYPLPLQSNIITLIIGCLFILIVDTTR